MKISQETIKILQNFASINDNIRIYPGNSLQTISPLKNSFAKAIVEEKFPKDFCVAELSKFLGLLSLMDDREIEFGEVSLKVSNDSGEFEFFYAEPSVIIAPPKDKKLPVDEVYKFSLTSSDIGMITKAAGIVNAKCISVISKNNKTVLSVGDPKNSSSSSYRKVLETSDVDFDVRLAIENLKIISENYQVTISKNKLLHFKCDSKPIEYFIALESDSTL